jgi:hypothetical protein
MGRAINQVPKAMEQAHVSQKCQGALFISFHTEFKIVFTIFHSFLYQNLSS